MLCRHCGAANPQERQFCRRCAASLHWQAVVGPSVSSGRHGLVGLASGAIVLVAGLLILYWPSASPPPGAAPDAPTSQVAESIEAPTATALPAPTPAPAPAGDGEARASLDYLDVAGPLLLQGRASFARFATEWRASDGYAARLAADPDPQVAAPIAQVVEQLQRELPAASATLRQQQAPSALQPLHLAILRALGSAGNALGKAAAVATRPEDAAIDEVGRWLDEAEQELERAVGELDAANALVDAP